MGFLGVVWPTYLLVPGGLRRHLLLAASLLFYGWWSVKFLCLLLATATFDWLLIRAMERWPDHRRRIVIASVLANLGVLAYFKYQGFFVAELNAALGTDLPILSLVLPVGISFYTFQAMACTIDVSRGHLPANSVRRLDDFLLFISFFPQLVAGPIERAGDLAPQLARLRRPTTQEVSEGVVLIAWGALKKVVMADNLAPLVAAGFDVERPTGFGVTLAAYAFTLQIYGDFSGYSDMARGIGRLFGVRLMQNFDAPLWAASPRELWRRWHISLSQWLRDYLYIPLGGGRKRAAFNLLLTMLLGGLWHGANWTFVLWGAWHGLALAVQRLLGNPEPRGLWRVPATVAMFHFTVFGFVLFRVADLHDLSRMFDPFYINPFPASADHYASLRLLACLATPVLLVDLALLWRRDVLALPPFTQPLLAGAAFALVVLLGATRAQTFIYFQF